MRKYRELSNWILILVITEYISPGFWRAIACSIPIVRRYVKSPTQVAIEKVLGSHRGNY